jgi:heat shock protein HslJ
MTRANRPAIALLLASISALASCTTAPSQDAERPTPPAAAAAVPSLTDTDWRCIELFDASGAPVDTTANPPTMRIGADGRASGFAGVNRYGCDARIGNSASSAEMPLSFGPVMATRMAGPHERMELERAFTAMLATVREAKCSRAADGTANLVLRSERGISARFAAVPVQ